MIQVSLKVDEESDPALAKWIMSFKGKRSKELSANIRRILRIHLIEQGTGQPDSSQEGSVDYVSQTNSRTR